MNKTDLSLLIAVGVIVAAASGTSFLGIRPLFDRYNSLRAEQTKTAKELQALEQRAATLNKLAQNRDEIVTLGEYATIYLPTEANTAPFLMDVEGMAQSAGTAIPTVNFVDSDAIKPGASLTEHALTLTAEGSFEQLKNLLRALEENLRFSEFASLTVSQQKDKLSLQITGALFSKPEDKNPKDTSLTIEQASKDLLLNRRVFGKDIQTSGPNRPDPFAGL